MKNIYIAVFISFFSILGAMEFDLEGDVKGRSELNIIPETDVEFDIRTRAELSIGFDSPLYISSKFELGYIDLDDELELKDFTNIETKNLYMGYETETIEILAGMIDLSSPGKNVYDSENFGLRLKYKKFDYTLESFYSLTNLLSDSLELNTKSEELNHLLFTGLKYDNLFESELWGMYLADNSHDDFSYCYPPADASPTCQQKMLKLAQKKCRVFHPSITNIRQNQFPLNNSIHWH